SPRHRPVVPGREPRRRREPGRASRGDDPRLARRLRLRGARRPDPAVGRDRARRRSPGRPRADAGCHRMKLELGDGYEVDDDRGRVDVDAVYEFLTHAYWALGRSREVVADILHTSALVVVVYHHGAQVGYARVLSDRHTTAYLADVYVLPEHRGK